MIKSRVESVMYFGAVCDDCGVHAPEYCYDREGAKAVARGYGWHCTENADHCYFCWPKHEEK